MNRSQLIDNFLAHIHRSLREGQRFLQDGSSKSYFELFWDTINNAFSTGLRGYRPPNYTVESFYRGTLDVKEFSLQVRETVINKHINKLDVNCDPLLTISWDQYSFIESRKKLCEAIPKLCRRHLWGIFNKLDCDGSGFASLEDIIDVILKIYETTGTEEREENIKEWFCDAARVDFWSFYSTLVEAHSHLLTPSNLQTVYDVVFYEILKEGKMKKKGHKVANWRERWFVLSTTQLCYYESEENRNLKGTVIINANSVVEKLPHTKDHPYLFRLVDGKSKVPYDISCSDPQKMNNWIEILEMAIKAHSVNGYSTLHKLREARRKLFPNEHQSAPNNPISKVMPMDHSSSPSASTSSTDMHAPYPTVTTTNSRQELPPLPDVQPWSDHQSSVSDSNSTSTYESIKSGPGPKVQPYKKDSNQQNAEHKGGGWIPSNPQTKPQPKSMKPSVSSGAVYHRESNDQSLYVNLQQCQRSNELENTLDGVSFSLSNTSLPPQQPRIYPPSNTVTPMPQNNMEHRGYVNVNHVTVSGNDYALVSKGKVDDTLPPTPLPTTSNSVNPPAINKPAPVPRKRVLKHTQSSPSSTGPTPQTNIVRQNSSGNLDYPILEFNDGTTSSSQQQVAEVVPKPLSYMPPKQEFDYTEVLLDGNVKDVGTAVQLKGNKPPPTPPSRYTPKSPQPPSRIYQNVPIGVAATTNGQFTTLVPQTASSQPTQPNDELSPPPPPPRRQSKRPPEDN